MTIKQIFMLTSLLFCASCFSQQPAKGGPQVTACPDDFFNLIVHPDARLCQVFATELPASMIYHLNQSPQQALKYYLQQLGSPQKQQQIKGRTVLSYADGDHIVVLSEDGEGTQVDILIKAQ